jgi:hypothetical protein
MKSNRCTKRSKTFHIFFRALFPHDLCTSYTPKFSCMCILVYGRYLQTWKLICASDLLSKRFFVVFSALICPFYVPYLEKVSLCILYMCTKFGRLTLFRCRDTMKILMENDGNVVSTECLGNISMFSLKLYTNAKKYSHTSVKSKN